MAIQPTTFKSNWPIYTGVSIGVLPAKCAKCTASASTRRSPIPTYSGQQMLLNRPRIRGKLIWMTYLLSGEGTCNIAGTVGSPLKIIKLGRASFVVVNVSTQRGLTRSHPASSDRSSSGCIVESCSVSTPSAPLSARTSSSNSRILRWTHEIVSHGSSVRTSHTPSGLLRHRHSCKAICRKEVHFQKSRELQLLHGLHRLQMGD